VFHGFKEEEEEQQQQQQQPTFLLDFESFLLQNLG